MSSSDLSEGARQLFDDERAWIEKAYAHAIDFERCLADLGVEFKSGSRVLLLACGPGHECSALLARNPKILVASDLDWRWVEIARSMAALPPARSPLSLACSVTALPFRAGEFDVVICRGALAYVVDIHATISEMARVTKPAGQLCLEWTTYGYYWHQYVKAVRASEKKHRLLSLAFGLVSTVLDRPLYHDVFYGKRRIRRLLEQSGVTPRRIVTIIDHHVPICHRALGVVTRHSVRSA